MYVFFSFDFVQVFGNLSVSLTMSSSFIGSKIAIITKSQCRYVGTIIGKLGFFPRRKKQSLFRLFLQGLMLKHHRFFLEMSNVWERKIAEEIFPIIKWLGPSLPSCNSLTVILKI